MAVQMCFNAQWKGTTLGNSIMWNIPLPLCCVCRSLRLYPQAWIVWMNGSTWEVIDRLMALKRCWQCVDMCVCVPVGKVTGQRDKIPADQIKCSLFGRSSHNAWLWPEHLIFQERNSTKANQSFNLNEHCLPKRMNCFVQVHDYNSMQCDLWPSVMVVKWEMRAHCM